VGVEDGGWAPYMLRKAGCKTVGTFEEQQPRQNLVEKVCHSVV
jgi:hypothetical protein